MLKLLQGTFLTVLSALCVTVSPALAERRTPPEHEHCSHRLYRLELKPAFMVTRTEPFTEFDSSEKIVQATQELCTRVHWMIDGKGGSWVIIPGSRRVKWTSDVIEFPSDIPYPPSMATLTIGPKKSPVSPPQ